MGASSNPDHEDISPAWWAAFTTYFGYAVLFMFGFIRDFTANIFKPSSRPPDGYAQLKVGYEDFYTRRLFHRIQDCWNRPISSCPGTWIDVLERESIDYNRVLGYGFNKALRLTGRAQRCLNLGSYNYLGFGDPDSPCKPAVLKALRRYGVSTSSARPELGTTDLLLRLERQVAAFVRKPAAMVFGMGFGTNSTGLPSLMGKGTLIISDAYNHSSIVTGARVSGARVRVFAHNDVADLEAVVRQAIVQGQPRTHRPWRKIWIVVEGIYSMEGEMSPLKEIVRVKNKYRCYLFLDEAHSIGALGKSGRGLCEHAGVNPDDVDVMMGTFTKSFGAVGGYMAANSDVIDIVRHRSAGNAYSAGLAPAAIQQCISALEIIEGKDGTDLGRQKLQSLRDNANMFRRRLESIGFKVIGHTDSAVLPIMLYAPTKIPAFSRECLKENLAVVVVGFPATPLLTARARVCISAAHTRKDLEEALVKLERVGRKVGVLYGKSVFGS